MQAEIKMLGQTCRFFLSQIAPEYADGSERYQYLVKNAVDKGLRAKGFYNTKYQFVLEPRKGKKPILVLNVELDKETIKIDENGCTNYWRGENRSGF